MFFGDPFWETNLGEKRSHAAWRSFLVFPKRSHAAWRSFSVCRMSWNVIKITVLERGTRLGGPQGILRGMLLGHFFALSLQKQNFPDLHMIRVKPIAVFYKMVSSKRGSLEEGSGDSFCLYRPKSNFSGPQYNPLWAAYSFEQNGFILKGVLRGRPLGSIFARSFQRQIFPDPIWSTSSYFLFFRLFCF